VWVAYLAFLPGDLADRILGRVDRHAPDGTLGGLDGAAADPAEPLPLQPAQ
jgi:hypothetical protein